MPECSDYIGEWFTFHDDKGKEVPTYIGECVECKVLFPKGQDIPDFRLRMRVPRKGKDDQYVWVEMLRNWAYKCLGKEHAEHRKKEIYGRYGMEYQPRGNKEILDKIEKHQEDWERRRRV